MDDPLTIVCGAIDNHVKMINEYKGVPGVQASRLQEGYQVLQPPPASLDSLPSAPCTTHCCLYPHRQLLSGVLLPLRLIQL